MLPAQNSLIEVLLWIFSTAHHLLCRLIVFLHSHCQGNEIRPDLVEVIRVGKQGMFNS
ncbi:hypothetical protein SDC9_139500 [bioreactor metagenome]|uniref:Uncharacterized protein n=1 Tax=bioreactor metagenome TaxID=1076179 RepID=A0A645DSW5_9ZZZZ